MKKYLARRKNDGTFLNRGGSLTNTTIDKITDTNWWDKESSITKTIIYKNSELKGWRATQHKNTPPYDIKDYEIIELDISELLMDRIQKRSLTSP